MLPCLPACLPACLWTCIRCCPALHLPGLPPTTPDADAAVAALQRDLDTAQTQFKEFELKDTKVRGGRASQLSRAPATGPGALSLRRPVGGGAGARDSAPPSDCTQAREGAAAGRAHLTWPRNARCPACQVRTDLKHLKAKLKKAAAKKEADGGEAQVGALRGHGVACGA
jgi:hypothetical protein